MCSLTILRGANGSSGRLCGSGAGSRIGDTLSNVDFSVCQRRTVRQIRMFMPHTFASTDVCRVCMHMRVYACNIVYMPNVYAYACMCVYMPNVHAYACMCVYMPNVYAHACMCVYMPNVYAYACVCICTRLWYAYACICIGTRLCGYVQMRMHIRM